MASRAILLICVGLVVLLQSHATAQDAGNEISRQRDDDQSATRGGFDPTSFFDGFFGGDTADDDEALAAVDIPLREERHIGETASKAYIEALRRKGISVTSRGQTLNISRSSLRSCGHR